MAGLADMRAYIMLVGYIGIFGAIILYVLSSTQTSIGSDLTAQMNYAFGNATAAIMTFFLWMGIIVVIICAGIVLSTLVGDFIGGGGGGGRGRGRRKK
ncbi:MAG: hypothetical protein Sv326_0442 [Candidatus Fermentimicrarchaeum limneticum]|uniref:Uncharacterized protein n=1 Tax=Fermentimicrarchaeum limneticum TaxID=2795018 RepID=A0A7D6BQ80_FERL1|nr:MAG: hypothetical protein Sv326_0368 [Candidatus Fermentimicrarchaeum limneticum]QLJ52580.1 MAG: hypothetical protein Sv326_0405 [Candidatus Fermentimicrarchaeum limneticum]QLJ52617.1 MAG: hypothetical protein Sv326_0442 [Candidatus Fermentimicrarchaeum limneticum]